jgi:hypothetical protein
MPFIPVLKNGAFWHNFVKAQVKGFDLDTLIEQISGYFKIEAELIKSTAKLRQASRARSLLCYLAVSRLNITVGNRIYCCNLKIQKHDHNHN